MSLEVNSFGDGLTINLFLTLPMFTDATGPSHGISDIAKAAEAPNVPNTSGSFSFIEGLSDSLTPLYNVKQHNIEYTSKYNQSEIYASAAVFFPDLPKDKPSPLVVLNPGTMILQNEAPPQ